MPRGGEDAQGRRGCPGEVRMTRGGEDAQGRRGCPGEARLPRGGEDAQEGEAHHWGGGNLENQ